MGFKKFITLAILGVAALSRVGHVGCGKLTVEKLIDEGGKGKRMDDYPIDRKHLSN
jgi:hypothetical protein